MIYLPEDQALKLSQLSKLRNVTKTALVRVAVERLFADLNHGQLDLPLGLERR